MDATVVKKVFARTKTLVGFFCIALLVALGYKTYVLTEEPGKDKECEPLFPDALRASAVEGIEATTPLVSWIQKGGTINDASCLDETSVAGIVQVKSEDDIRNALTYAKESGRTISMAGARHSMGGHAFWKGSIVLDMTQFNGVEVDADARTMRVESGATWHQIQNKLHPRFAVMAMQSTDIFTVGGSISVNAHGMDHQAGALENSIVSMRVMTADGKVHTVSRTEHPFLYEHIVGGYGLFGVILDATLRIVPNDVYASKRSIIDYTEFPELFAKEIEPNTDIGLTYTHLSTAPGDSYLKEAIVYQYERQEPVALDAVPPLGEVSSIKLRRLVMNLSKYGDVFQTLRWWSEKYLEPKMESCSLSRNQAQGSGEACLVARNEPMHDSVPYLKNSLKRETDILHEYFIPRKNIISFIDGLRDIMRENDTNLLNASIRVVHKERGALTYAPEEAFSVVLYINQRTDAEGNSAMQKTTRELIDLTHNEGGRFFLPYQLHYTPEQLSASYPNIEEFFARKREYDPKELFTNTWYERYGKENAV